MASDILIPGDTCWRIAHVAILTLLAIVAVLSLLGDIKALAQATVLLLLTVFTAVNIALVILKRRPEEKPGQFEVPIIVPILGAIICATLIVVRMFQEGGLAAPAIAFGLIALIAVLYFVTGAGQDQERLQRFIEQDEAAAEA